jgi:hypothetical protein
LYRSKFSDSFGNFYYFILVVNFYDYGLEGLQLLVAVTLIAEYDYLVADVPLAGGRAVKAADPGAPECRVNGIIL